MLRFDDDVFKSVDVPFDSICEITLRTNQYTPVQSAEVLNLPHKQRRAAKLRSTLLRLLRKSRFAFCDLFVAVLYFSNDRRDIRIVAVNGRCRIA